MTQSVWMRANFTLVAVAALAAPVLLQGQMAADDPVAVFTAHPRLFLRPARLRLLRRERERASERWRQFASAMAESAADEGGIPEPGFAAALNYQVSGDQAMGRRAVNWALGEAGDLRQLALVFDWCQDLMTGAERERLTARLLKGISETASGESIPAVRGRVLAAVALYDHVPEAPERELERVVRLWWLGRMAPALQAGGGVVPRADAYALYEILHALLDNTNVDLRDGCPAFFRDFPIGHLMSYYPAPYAAPENDYYMGAGREIGDPDPRQAALSRAAELAMVAYDTNAPSSQVLQGWLTHDRFLMRSAFGIPYEFLWANPYQPGLSYYDVPLVYHNPEAGRLFIRESWDDTAIWFGAFDGVLQFSQGGHTRVLDPAGTPPLALPAAVVCFGRLARKFRVTVEKGQAVFVVGLEPRHTYLVEVDDEEMFEAASDAGGILALPDVPYGRPAGVRLQ